MLCQPLPYPPGCRSSPFDFNWGRKQLPGCRHLPPGGRAIGDAVVRNFNDFWPRQTPRIARRDAAFRVSSIRPSRVVPRLVPCRRPAPARREKKVAARRARHDIEAQAPFTFSSRVFRFGTSGPLLAGRPKLHSGVMARSQTVAGAPTTATSA